MCLQINELLLHMSSNKSKKQNIKNFTGVKCQKNSTFKEFNTRTYKVFCLFIDIGEKSILVLPCNQGLSL